MGSKPQSYEFIFENTAGIRRKCGNVYHKNTIFPKLSICSEGYRVKFGWTSPSIAQYGHKESLVPATATAAASRTTILLRFTVLPNFPTVALRGASERKKQDLTSLIVGGIPGQKLAFLSSDVKRVQ